MRNKSNPIVVRPARNPVVILVAIVIFALAAWIIAKPNFEHYAKLDDQFSIRGVKVEFPDMLGGQVTWKISGMIINQTRGTLPAPDVQIELQDETGKALESTLVKMNRTAIPSAETRSFSGELKTGPGAKLTPVLRPVEATP